MSAEPERPLAGQAAPPGQPPLERTRPAWEAAVATRFGDVFRVERFADNVRLIVPPEAVYDVLGHLKADAGFDMLVDVTAVDYLEYPDATDRFGVIYALLNTATGERLFVKTFLNEPDLSLPSAVPLWRAADWLEREVFDMFGIRFDGHPD
ncbi:MAG TPA: NADH-quinone oxidoreductase subunit C, partial [Planctomycetaceae bacterium]